MFWGNMVAMMDRKVAFAGLAIVVAQLSTSQEAALGKSLFPLVVIPGLTSESSKPESNLNQ